MKHLTMMGILTLAALVVGCDKVEQGEQKTKLEVTRSEPQSAKVGAISENLEVTKWGPQSANVGTVPNKQPNGSMGIWIQVSGTQGLGNVQVLFDGQSVKTAVREKVITAAIPSEQIAKAGNKEVVIKQTKTGKVFPVGTFAVKP